MRSDVIVLLSPTRNQGFGFFQGEEDLVSEYIFNPMLTGMKVAQNALPVDIDQGADPFIHTASALWNYRV